VAELGIAKRVSFCGKPADVRPFLRMADAFILPSRYEVFPMVVLEAAACGLPVITTRLNGVEEFAVTGVTGIVLEDSSSPAILAGLSRMIATPPEDRLRMGRNARAAVKSYGLGEFLQAWDNVYLETLTG
jgi:UDP-glucose:(heptosyl)LPS alpha-1,3-glucosyltransferase